MSFGVDFGNYVSVVGVPKAGGINILSNEVSKRETSSYVSFGDKERFLGEKGLDQAIRNWRNTVASVKRLIGIEYGSAAFQHELKYCKNDLRADENNLVEIKVKYKWEDVWFKPEQLLGALFTRLRSYVEADAAEDIKLAGGAKKEVRIPDCVVSVPAFFTDLQRRLTWQGLQISDLNPLSLMNETTAAALDYGIYKSANLPEKEEDAIVIAIIDIGHSATTASLVSFTKTQLKVLGHVFDPFLGGREFDYALYEHYKAETEKKYHYDMDSDKKSQIRLLNACEKLKKVLSANAVANMTCELTDRDVSFQTNREDTEKLWVPLLERMKSLVQKLEGLPNFNRLSSVELIGGGIRVPAVKTVIAEALGGRTLSTTLNTSESIAKGCSIMAAMLSPNFKVREYTVIDSNVYTVALGYHSDKGGSSIHPQFPELNKKMTVLKPGEACPKTLNLTFERTNDFELCVFYDENSTVSALNGNPLIGKWKVAKIPQVNNATGVKVRLRLAPMMTVSIEGATVSEEVEEVEEYEVEVEEDAAPAEGAAEGEKEGEKKEEKPKQKKKVKQQRTVKRAKKHECSVETLLVRANPQDKVKEYTDREKQMIQSDSNVRDTQEAKNSVESWIYDTRNKIAEGGLLFEFSKPEEREALQPALTAGEDWLYGDGEDTSKEDYVEKLKELQKAASSITQRYQDHLDTIRKAKEEEERKKKEEEDRKKKEEEERKKKEAEEKKQKEAEEKAKTESQPVEGETKPSGDKMDLD